jgi:hypothetical protein
MPEDALSWLAGLPRAVQTALLANPSGDLPPDPCEQPDGSFRVKRYGESSPSDSPDPHDEPYDVDGSDGDGVDDAVRLLVRRGRR